MAIDYEFQKQNEQLMREVSMNLLEYFEKNPDRAKRHYGFVDSIKSYLHRDRSFSDTEELNFRTRK